jgi:ABC-type nitrate/sulfonate/bicarbonate transport system ATPase subunit
VADLGEGAHHRTVRHHSTDEALFLADRIAVPQPGRITAAAPIDLPRPCDP